MLQATDTSLQDFIENALVNVARSNTFSDPAAHPQIPHEPKEKITFQLRPSGSPHKQLDSCQK